MPENAPATSDEEHLKLLSIFHYVVAGITALFALFPIFHLVLGLLLIFAPEKFNGGKPPALLGELFVAVAATLIALGWIFAALIALTGRFLARRSHYTFCLGMAGFECLLVPLGTVLGVFTIIVLTRDSVKQLFRPDDSLRDPWA